MKVDYKEVKKEEISNGIYRRWLIDEKIEAKNFFMRLFEILPNKEIVIDQHPYEHEIFILEGRGIATIGKEILPISKGDALFISPNEIHSIKNTGSEILQFLCMVPSSYREFQRW